jgi:3-oxoacyl-[acyl-carrier-protein] synthase II
MEQAWLPPTVNLDSPDAACALDHVPRAGLQGAPEHILSNSFGFGGINAALVLRRAD